MSTEQSLVDLNSTQLLQSQVESLEKLADLQRKQIRALEQLKISMAGSGQNSVKIEDVNMPFFHLVGLLVKFALAAIPAAIILTLVYMIIGFILTLFGLGFLSAL